MPSWASFGRPSGSSYGRDAVLLQPSVQRGTRQPQRLGRLHPVATSLPAGSAALPQRRDGHRGLEVGQELSEREPGVEARVGQGGRNIDLLPGLDYLEDEVAESLDAVCCEFVQVADDVERRHCGGTEGLPGV